MSFSDDIQREVTHAMRSKQEAPSPIEQALKQCNAARETLRGLERVYIQAYPNSSSFFAKDVPASELENIKRIAEFQGNLNIYSLLLQSTEAGNLSMVKTLCDNLKATMAAAADLLGTSFLPASKVPEIASMAQSTQTILKQQSEAVGVILAQMPVQKVLAAGKKGFSLN